MDGLLAGIDAIMYNRAHDVRRLLPSLVARPGYVMVSTRCGLSVNATDASQWLRLRGSTGHRRCSACEGL